MISVSRAQTNSTVPVPGTREYYDMNILGKMYLLGNGLQPLIQKAGVIKHIYPGDLVLIQSRKDKARNSGVETYDYFLIALLSAPTNPVGTDINVSVWDFPLSLLAYSDDGSFRGIEAYAESPPISFEEYIHVFEMEQKKEEKAMPPPIVRTVMRPNRLARTPSIEIPIGDIRNRIQSIYIERNQAHSNMDQILSSIEQDNMAQQGAAPYGAQGAPSGEP